MGTDSQGADEVLCELEVRCPEVRGSGRMRDGPDARLAWLEMGSIDGGQRRRKGSSGKGPPAVIGTRGTVKLMKDTST